MWLGRPLTDKMGELGAASKLASMAAVHSRTRATIRDHLRHQAAFM
jgi:hypothetical protein